MKLMLLLAVFIAAGVLGNTKGCSEYQKSVGRVEAAETYSLPVNITGAY